MYDQKKCLNCKHIFVFKIYLGTRKYIMYRFEFRFNNAEVSNICRMKSDICILIVLTYLCVTSCVINSVSEKINFLRSEANLSVGPIGVKIVMIGCKELLGRRMSIQKMQFRCTPRGTT